MLKGSLSSFSLGEIFQSLSVNNHTGTLKITTKDGQQKCIYFSGGEISLFSSGSNKALRIGEILIRQKKLSAADLRGALEEQKSTGEVLGKILLRKGIITKDDLRLALETKIRDEIYDLFLISEAEFEFHINHLPEEAFDPLLKNTRIAINTSSVVLEGIRRVDEWRLIQRRLKTFEEIFVPLPAPEGPAVSPAAAEMLRKLDGATPVQQVLEAHGGSRFEGAKMLYELLESGRIRPLTIDEAIGGGERAQKEGRLELATSFFRFADQLDPERIEVLRPLSSCLEQLGRVEEARGVKARALRIYSQGGQHQQVMEVGRSLIAPGENPAPETVEMVFRSALALGLKDDILSAGDLTARLALERKDIPKVEEVLEELWKRRLKDLNFRIELAEVLARSGEKERAIRHIEAVAEELQSQKRLKDLIKVLQLIFEIDPQRQDIKHRLQNLLIQQERIELRKKRRITIAGSCVILLLLASTVPLFYELKARELYCHAQRLEEISLNSNDFNKAKEAYAKILNLYGFSTRASHAQLALERVAIFEKVRREAIDNEKAALEKAQANKLRHLREAFPGLLAEAKRLEEKGKIQEAHEIYTRISTEFSEVPGARNILFPILISSSPRGAMVEVNGAAQGTTPLVIHASKGQELTIAMTRVGCEPIHEKAVGGQSWRIHLQLNRRPLGEMKFSGPIHQPLDASGGRIIFPSRDGHLYAVVPGKKEVAWQRKVGQYGDLVSDIGSAGEEILLGTVNGEVAAISRENGKSRWRNRFGAAVLARPVLSPDGRWVAAASVDGEVALFDYATGEPKGAFRAEDEILGAPAFIGDRLVVGCTDQRLYELQVPTAAPRRAVEFPHPISTDMVPHSGGVVFGTSQGLLHRYDIEDGRVLWSRFLGAELTGPPAVEGDRAYAGTADGQVVAVDLGKGTIVWRLEISKGRVGKLLVAGSHLFAGSESGDLVCIALSNGAKEWSFKSDSAILAPPLSFSGRLYIPCATGKILVMENLE